MLHYQNIAIVDIYLSKDMLVPRYISMLPMAPGMPTSARTTASDVGIDTVYYIFNTRKIASTIATDPVP
jgi:hypothetical protein